LLKSYSKQAAIEKASLTVNWTVVLVYFQRFCSWFSHQDYKKGAIRSMEDIEKVLEQIKEWVRKLIEGLLNPEAQPELEPIPIPVNEPRRRR
jgi:hypothetical protein